MSLAKVCALLYFRPLDPGTFQKQRRLGTKRSYADDPGGDGREGKPGQRSTDSTRADAQSDKE